MTAPYIPGAYLAGGAITHFLSLLLQTGVQVNMTWICNKDLALLVPPTTEASKPKPKPKLTLHVNRLNAKSTTTSVVEEEEKTMGEEEDVMTGENKEKNCKYFYEVKYPELVAAMMQTKVVSLTKKEGFEFIDYYYSRGNKKQN